MIEPRATLMSPIQSTARSPENKIFYNSEINSVTFTPNSQTHIQIHFENTLGEGTSAHFQANHYHYLPWLSYSESPFHSSIHNVSVSDKFLGERPSGSHGLRPNLAQPFNSFWA